MSQTRISKGQALPTAVKQNRQTGTLVFLLILIFLFCGCQPRNHETSSPSGGEEIKTEPMVPKTEPEIWIEIPENPYETKRGAMP